MNKLLLFSFAIVFLLVGKVQTQYQSAKFHKDGVTEYITRGFDKKEGVTFHYHTSKNAKKVKLRPLRNVSKINLHS